ncbi:hypothetical protein L7F22_002512 [Adiantum nelumboides]|nr:hypothetical protein [Adiantum nelumboides]
MFPVDRYGHVRATKLAAYKLLQAKEHVLLFPGGAREVCKKKNEEYKLIWKPTAEFVRMAARFNAIIVPFGALGGDDAYKILFDADDIMRSALAPLVTDLYNRIGIGLDTIYPVTALPGTNIPSLLAIPNIERIYFHFAEPVDTASFKGTQHDSKFDEMYSLVKSRVEDSITWLKTQSNALNVGERATQKGVWKGFGVASTIYKGPILNAVVKSYVKAPQRLSMHMESGLISRPASLHIHFFGVNEAGLQCCARTH